MDKSQKEYIGNLIKGIGRRFNKLFSSDNRKAGLTWYKEKQLKHMPYNQPNVYDLNGMKIHFNNGPEILHSLKEIFAEEVYNIKFDTSSPKILDCGANIGLSVLYFKGRYPAAKITAFEPDPLNFSLLKKNIELNGYRDVDLRNEAIWKDNTPIEFVSDGTLGSKINATGNNKNTVSIKATRLKDLLDHKIDFLKLDIEGAEYEVLKDCAQNLQNVQNMFLEFHGYFKKNNELTEIFQLLQNNGFSYYIKEATDVYSTPFNRENQVRPYDIQLNIFCFRIMNKN